MATKSVLRKALLIPYQLYVVLFFIPLTVMWKIVTIVASFADAEGNLAHRCWSNWARSSLALAGLRIRVEGLERIDPERTYVFMSNHASFLDILLAFAYFPLNFRFIIKEEVFSIPFVGWALRRSGHIPITRENPRKGLKSLKQAEDLLREGVSIVVFPEGTRTPNGEVQEFKSMLFVLPIRSRLPVAPVLFEGTFQALKRGSILLNPVPLRVTFYEPVPPVSLDDRDRNVYSENIRQSLLVKISHPRS